MTIEEYPSRAAKEFSSRISGIENVEMRARLRDDFEAICEEHKGYDGDGYNHEAERFALQKMQHRLKACGV